ncbi:hypothetical protein [Treponema sp.]|uniref:hypothetical protein n=1 Tax=Treponema sp. TaxID=166 RepID=UPI00388F8C3D
MPKYIEAVKAAEIIAERTKFNMVYLVDWFCEIASEDVKPVVHAHWILRRPFAQCSECKRFCGQWDYDSADHFCRNCGAKMDEEPEADER